ncbi:MAG: hypothetical protein NTZ78_08750 [Candidatus Aureabacteria bacterium]|nr:hypothetical protein [Candidatus Auribacterota bacterium]
MALNGGGGEEMKNSEIRSVLPASIFVLFFSVCFVMTLIYGALASLQIVSGFSLAPLHQIKDRIAQLGPIPRVFVSAFAIGFAGGIGGTLLALVYNVFAGIFGGVRADISEREKQ